MIAWFWRLRYLGGKSSAVLDVRSKNRRIMAEGHTLYSYGLHFPLVRWIPEFRAFTLNSCKYSRTTSRHFSIAKKIVEAHCKADYFIESGPYGGKAKMFTLCSNDGNWLPEKHSSGILGMYDKRIALCADKSRRAKIEYRKIWYSQCALRCVAERNSYVETFLPLFAEQGIPEHPQLPEDVSAALVLMKLLDN